MRQRPPSISSIKSAAADAAFGRPLVTNTHRGLIAEAIVAAALGPDWRWCSGDYSSWDFERSDGVRLEVKQSAARQSWSDGKAPSSCSFDIAARKGRWEGMQWIDAPGRNAQVYVFAHHPRHDDTADHRDARQWEFYAIHTSRLPSTKRVGLAGIRALAAPCRYGDLAATVFEAAIPPAPAASP